MSARTVVPSHNLVAMPWRVGTQVGRTIYACPPGSHYRHGEVLIGMMDSVELAREAVDAHNAVLSAAPGADATEFVDP
jgi:hypothetical protein